MDLALLALGSAAGLLVGWLIPGFQHLLYRQPEYRAEPARGRRLLAMRIATAAAIATVAGFALRPGHYDLAPALLTVLFSTVLTVLASTDFERRLLPNRLMYPALIAAAASCWAWPDRSASDVAAGTGVAAAIALTFYALGLALGFLLHSRASLLGFGDVKLVVLLGLLLGWPAIMPALLAGAVLAGMPGLLLTLLGRGRSVFSYGPYLALAGIIALIWPERFL